MSLSSSATPAPIYPAHCFSASPTFNKWVRLSIADTHRLRHEWAYEGQAIYFHLNHPIQYVYLVGAVVAIDVPDERSRFYILTLDDGSGATIEVKIERVIPPPENKKHGKRHESGQQPRSQLDADTSSDSDSGDETRAKLMTKVLSDDASTQGKKLAVSMPWTAQTLTPDVTITTTRGDDPRGVVCIGEDSVDIGTVIKAKGTLQRWRNVFQLKLLRTAVVQSTTEEAKAWTEYADFVEKILARPWTLTDEQVRKLEERAKRRAQSEARKANERRLNTASTTNVKDSQDATRIATGEPPRNPEHANFLTDKQDTETAKAKARDKEKSRRERRQRWEASKQKRVERAEERRVQESLELDGNPLDRPGWRPG